MLARHAPIGLEDMFEPVPGVYAFGFILVNQFKSIGFLADLELMKPTVEGGARRRWFSVKVFEKKSIGYFEWFKFFQ